MTDDDEINDFIFYKITCLDASKNLLYIGQTTNMKKRESLHKHNCNYSNRHINTKIYTIIRANEGWSNFRMDAFDKKEQITKREAKKLEKKFIIDLKANMNTAHITEEQKIKYKEQKKKYKEEETTCSCGCIVQNCHLKSHQESNEHINKMKIINTP